MRFRMWAWLTLIIIILAGIANGANLGIRFASISNPSPIVTGLIALCFIAGIAGFILTEIRRAREIDEKVAAAIKQEQRKCSEELGALHRVALTELLRAARHYISPKPAQARACIFLLDPDLDQLYMYHHSGEYNDQEQEIKFGIQQGVVGYVLWQSGEPICVDLDGITYDELSQKWRLDAEQAEATRMVKTVLAVPIPNPNNRRHQLIGVLAIDSKQPPEISGLGNVAVVSKAVNLAEKQLTNFIINTAYRPIQRP
ncbi:MAG: GAF domain-containing protein [Anaerolineae bacterium]|nr:GAF domain-containing protein [Anaerolineae bacterium]